MTRRSYRLITSGVKGLRGLCSTLVAIITLNHEKWDKFHYEHLLTPRNSIILFKYLFVCSLLVGVILP